MKRKSWDRKFRDYEKYEKCKWAFIRNNPDYLGDYARFISKEIDQAFMIKKWGICDNLNQDDVDFRVNIT
jgi:hypothetical protein